MSKELTAYPTLDSLVKETINRKIRAEDDQEHYECVEHDKLKAGWFKDDVDFYSQVEKTLKDVEKNKKALEIIKKKRVDVDLFLTIMEDKNQDDKLWSYNFWNSEKNSLTKEEYELLKEVLI